MTPRRVSVTAGTRTVRVGDPRPGIAKKSDGRPRRWIGYAACAWATLFALPHIWWALDVPAGFPGGEASYHQFISSTWRYAYDVAVVVLCAVAVLVTLAVSKRRAGPARSFLRALIWLGSAALSFRGAAGLVVDGASDPIWWPAFLVGGVLFGGVAWSAREKTSPGLY